MSSTSIVAVIPKTGPRSAWGDTVDGEWCRDHGVKLIDDCADPKRSIEIAKHLCKVRPYAVIGHFSSEAARHTVLGYAEAGIKAVYPLSSANDLKNLAAPHPEIVMMSPKNRDQVQSVAEKWPTEKINYVAASKIEKMHGIECESLFIQGRLDEINNIIPQLLKISSQCDRVILSDDAWAGGQYRNILDPLANSNFHMVTTSPKPPEIMRHALEVAWNSQKNGNISLGPLTELAKKIKWEVESL